VQEKQKLLMMASSSLEGKELYQQWVLQDNRSLLHILEDLPSCKPSLDLVCELLTRLQSRYYSISSSSKVPNLMLLFSNNVLDLLKWIRFN
jgi:NADPH-ferrihemoprotein reductase